VQRATSVDRRGGPDVLLITVDTLRADALGSYGNPRAATPWMDRLAGEGVRFADAHAHNVVTLPSHVNILSGRLPTDHGVRDNSGFRFPPAIDTLATLLKARGYRTGAFVSAFPVAARFGLARGFDVYEDAFADAASRPAFLMQERRGPETVALARGWLDAQQGAPTFAWVHIYEPHFPYAPPEPFAARFASEPYAGEVAATDAALQPLLEPLLAAGRDGRTLVVLTADHGESLGEHGEATHGIFAYEGTLRVPLVLYQPRLLTPGVVTTPAAHVDVLPTVLDALGLPVPPGLPGRSLLPAAAGRADEGGTVYFEALSGSLNRGWAPLHGVIRDRVKYVDLPIPELYDLARDPGEATNLAARDGARRETLRGLMAAFRSADRAPGRSREDAETRERLRGLGYLAGGAAVPPAGYTEEDDPKRLIGLDTLLQEIADRYLSGDLPGALARCRELVRRRPGMAVSLLHLAHLERESGNLTAAVDALRQALALDPGDTEVASLLGGYLTQAGRPREAADLLEPYAARPDPDVQVLVARALALARLRQPQAALATLARAREVDPSNAMILVDVGTVHLMAEAREPARKAFEDALALNPRVARAHSSLGAMAAEEGRAEAAAAHWKAAVAADPREHDKILALGLGLWRQGRPEGRPYLEFFVTSAPPAVYARQIEGVRGLLAAGRPRG
jgi:choline-sulfatase